MHFKLAAVKKHTSTITTTTIILHALLLVEDLVQRVSTEFRHPFSIFFEEVRKSSLSSKKRPTKLALHIYLYISPWPASAAETNNLTSYIK